MPPSASAARRLAAATLLGFTSGLPLALSGTALQAWLTVAGHDVSTIGFLTLIGLPYTFKFLWAPLMDRFEPPGFGRRRGWIVLTQLGLFGALQLLSRLPESNVGALAAVAACIAFLSASQDIVIDAWRTDAMSAEERGLAASLGVLGYRLAMVVSGGIALIWADPTAGGMTWPDVYRRLAWVLVAVGAIAVPLVPTMPRRAPDPDAPPARQELAGFAAVLSVAALGWAVTRWPGTWLGTALVTPLGFSPKTTAATIDLVAVLAGIAVALPLAPRLARRFGYATLLGSMSSFFALPRAGALLTSVVLYMLGVAFAQSLNTTFLLKGPGFTTAEVGVVNKVFGIWLTVLGALLGGALLPRLGLFRAMVTFGVVQALAVVGFLGLAVSTRGAWGVTPLPPFDLGFVWLKEAVDVDHGLLAAVAIENVTSGMGTAAFVAYQMALARSRFSATQYALVSALAAVGRVWVGPFGGVLAEVAGWPTFYVVAIFMGLPGVALVWSLRPEIQALEKREG